MERLAVSKRDVKNLFKSFFYAFFKHFVIKIMQQVSYALQ
jgi:hypothetical protein